MDCLKVNVKIPEDCSWKEFLRFYCQTCDYDDPSLPFMASMWSYAIANDGLTGKQAESAFGYIAHRYKKLGLAHPWINGDE